MYKNIKLEKSYLTVINTQTDFVTASKVCNVIVQCTNVNQSDIITIIKSIWETLDLLLLLLCVKSILDQLNDDILTPIYCYNPIVIVAVVYYSCG